MRRSIMAILLGACLLSLALAPAGAERPLLAAGEGGQQPAEGGQAADTSAARPLAGGMQLAAETDALRLYANPETAEIAVEQRNTGEMWLSNPPQRMEDEQATPLFKSLLSSQFTLTYYSETGQLKTLNSYDDSVKRGQSATEAIPGGVRTVYTLGNLAKGADVIPKAIGKERFETEILQKIADEDARTRVKLRFTLDEEKGIYTPRKMQNFVLEEMAAVLESVGYTREDAERDNAENGIETAGEASLQFTVAVEYRLEGDRFVASVPLELLSYDERHPIQSIGLLDYFGAAGKQEEGYLFVPDGSGALIAFNNGKLASAPYEAPVYGQDNAVHRKEQVQTNETIRFPVYGMVRGKSAFLAVIEDGDALASVKADIGGRHHGYNSVSAKFELIKMDYITLTSGSRTSSIPVFQANMYGGELRVGYQFASGSEASYSGLAAMYRDRLAADSGWQQQSTDRDLPFILQLEGAFEKRKSFLGIPYKTTEALTTFNEAADIVAKLKEQGVGGIQLRYEGWSDKGIRHGAPSKLSPEAKLGGTSGFRRLADYLKGEGVAFYPDIALQRKYKGDSGAASYLNQKDAKIYAYNPVNYMEDKSKFSHYALSPASLPKATSAAMKRIGELEPEGLSLRDLGIDLNGDYDEKATVDRQTAKELVVASLATIEDEVDRLMIGGGNAYALAHAGTVVGAPMRSSGFDIIDEDVPFYQMVLHGYIDYAGEPWNMAESQDLAHQALKALETGSAVYFKWFHEEPSVMKDTDYDDLYSAHYLDWLPEAVQHYNAVNEVLAKVQGQTIDSHKKLAEQVYETVYGNGMRVIVNYGDEQASAGGATIPSKSYWAGGE